jgi:hypothetical protein
MKPADWTPGERERREAELDRLLNDPTTRLDAERVWALLAELSGPPERREAPSAA